MDTGINNLDFFYDLAEILDNEYSELPKNPEERSKELNKDIWSGLANQIRSIIKICDNNFNSDFKEAIQYDAGFKYAYEAKKAEVESILEELGL